MDQQWNVTTDPLPTATSNFHEILKLNTGKAFLWTTCRLLYWTQNHFFI